MLNKTKSKQILKLKYVLLIPVLAGMLIYTSCEKSEAEISKDASVQELLNDLNAKVEEKGLTIEEKKSLFEILNKTMKAAREEEKNDRKSTEEIVEVPISEMVLTDGVPFAAIEKSPIFPGCENAEDPKKCLQESIQKHVGRKFNTGLAKNLELEPGKKRVFVVFKIDNEGNIIDVKSRGPHADLEAEAMRVVKSLPKMIPGEHEGKKVAVKYTLPITLMIHTDEENKQGYNYQNPNAFESQPKVLASLNNSITQGVISGNINANVFGMLKVLPGVNVSIKGKSRTVVTDFDGNFKIAAVKEETLVFAFKGLPKTEFKINENNMYSVTM